MDENKSFNYTYSAKDMEELQNIRKKYVPEEEDEMQKLRKLDESVYKKPNIIAMSLGILGILVLGTGMSLSMVWADKFFVLGIVIGIIGIAGTLTAYPTYVRVLKREREKAAPEIIRLTEELMK